MTSPVVEPFVIMGPHFHSLSPESLIPVMKLPSAQHAAPVFPPGRAARCAGLPARARGQSTAFMAESHHDRQQAAQAGASLPGVRSPQTRSQSVALCA